MIKITNTATPIHTVNHPIEVVDFLLYSPSSPIPGYVELVARTLEGRELVQSYDRLYQLQTDKNYLIEYKLPLGVTAATISARLRIPYQPNHTREAWLQATVLSSDSTTTTDRLLALATAVGGLTTIVEGLEAMARRSESTTEQRVDVGTTNTQLVGADATGLRLSVIVAHAGTEGSVYIRTGADPATATIWAATLEPGDLIELETGEAVQALASAGTIPVNVTEVF